MSSATIVISFHKNSALLWESGSNNCYLPNPFWFTSNYSYKLRLYVSTLSSTKFQLTESYCSCVFSDDKSLLVKKRLTLRRDQPEVSDCDSLCGQMKVKYKCRHQWEGGVSRATGHSLELWRSAVSFLLHGSQKRLLLPSDFCWSH